MVIRTKDAEGKTLSQIRRAKRERRKKRKRAVLIAMLMLGICVGMLFTPLFNLKEIDIEGNSRVDAKTIIDASGFTLGENIFKFSLPKAGEAIASIPYINTIELQRKLPGKIEINGKNIKKYRSGELYNHCLAYLPQDVQTLFMKNTVAFLMAVLL